MNIKINKDIIFDYTSKKGPLIISEISSNHGGSKKKFLKLIEGSFDNGADLVKIQTYEPQDITLKENKFKIKNGLWKNKILWNLYKKACTPFEWHYDAFKIANKKKKILFSTPFSLRALNFLKQFNPKIYKISSFEITDLNLINEISKTRKPIILSTGASSIKEIENAIKVINNYHNKIIILHCISNYPTALNETNFFRLNYIKKKFSNNLIGLSDHTVDNYAALCASTLGIVAIEKHVKLNENSISEDSKFSISLKNLKKLKEQIQDINFSLSKSKNKIEFSLDKKNRIFRRSIFAKSDIEKGKKITKNDIQTLRPKIGLDADKFFKIIGKKTKKKINKNEPIFFSDLK
jgi:pseudaminic acid synthase